MEILSFGGVTFASIDWHTAVDYGSARGQYAVDTRVTPRPGNTSLLSPGAVSPLRLAVNCTLEPNSALELLPAIDQLIGELNPLDQTPRTLVATRNGVTVERQARVTVPSGWTSSMAANAVQVVFVSEDPEWTEQTATTVDQTGTVSPFSAAIANAGQAAVHPRYRVRWETQRVTKGVVVGQEYRKRMTLTNTQDRTVPPFPYRIDLGNTATLVTGSKAQSDGDDLQVIINGESVERKLIGWNKVQSYAWIVVPGIDAGETLTIDVVYGNSSATNPPEWDSVRDLTRPVPDLKSETGTATGGDTLQLIRASATWNTNEWYGGLLRVLTGANAGLERTVTFNTDTIVEVDPTWPNPITNGDTYLLSMSRNSRWIYAVRQTQRDSDVARGRFNVSSASFTPGDVSHEGPGSWAPALVADNRDSFGQKRVSMVTVGVSDKDPFAIVDAQRMWEGNDKYVYEPGTADGMSLTTPYPMTGLNWEYQLDNPNGMVALFVGARVSGSEDWAEVFLDDAATSGLESRFFSPTTLDLTSFDDEVYQLVTALIPSDESGEIPLDWRRDTGSATSGSTTTMTDSTKEWATDQFDNGKIRMLSGENAGKVRAITGNTPTVITHNAFPNANADGDRYVVTQKRLKGILRDGSKLYVDLDDSVLTDSGLGSETAVYDASMTLWIGAGPAGDPAGQHRALIGYAGTQKRLFLAADEQLEIDAALRRVRIWNTTSSTYTSELTDPAVIVQWHDGTDWRRSANWLPLGVGAQTAWLEETNMGELGVNVSYYPAYLGA